MSYWIALFISFGDIAPKTNSLAFTLCKRNSMASSKVATAKNWAPLFSKISAIFTLPNPYPFALITGITNLSLWSVLKIL